MAKDNNTETEVKLLVDDLEAVAASLKDTGAELSAPRVYERNVRYDDDIGLLGMQGMVLRLRVDNRVRLTFKEENGQRDASGISERLEAEVEVSDFDTMELILDKLGFMPYAVYEKYRTTYTLDGAEITLDEMPYGSFVEIEGSKEVIHRLIEQLGLKDVPVLSAGYMELFERVREHLNLDFTDLTFENFEGLTVPREAFTTE